MAIQPLVARDDQFQAHAIGHQLRRDATPEECYQCEFAYQYLTTLTKWASMGATSATSATAAEKTDGTVIDEASITGRTVEQLETSIVATTNTIPQTTTEVAQSEDSASSPNFPKKDSSSFSKAWIAGAFVPSVLFVAMAVAFAIWWRRRRSRTPKTPKSLHADDMVGTSRFDKPELDSQGIPRPSNKEEVITSTRTAALDTVVLPVPADMPANDAPGSLNRAELQGEAKAARDKIMAPELTTSF
ncbi:hypothetical protein ACKAV7_012805 [Fusarium commune]